MTSSTTTAFRPRSVSEIVDAAVQLVRTRIGPFMLLATIVAIPTILLGLVTARLVPDPTRAAADPSAIFANFGKLLLLNLVVACWTFVGYGAEVGMADDVYHGRPTDPGAALRRAFGRARALIFGNLLAYLWAFAAMFVVAVLAGILIAVLARGEGAGTRNAGTIAGVGLVAFALLIAAFGWGLYAAGRYLVNVTPAVMSEGLGPMAAIRRSGALSAGSVRRVLGLLLVTIVIAMFVYVTFYFLVSAVLGSGQQQQQIAGALTNAALIPIAPFAAAAVTVLYYDLRIRKEGYDVELLAAELGDSRPAAAVPPGYQR